ncbi:MAG: cobyrinate a,c-diamide synthase [Lachnospiraceae bacterium]|nr:cobyrinate a,c-diamide synthase [Lachnospiraceae bacterium]
MKLKRVMIAAPKSGSGKTTITCALLQALKDRGHHVVSYKCGPDYIDPMFHQKVLDIPSKNLDTFFTGENETLQLFLKDRKEVDFAVLEGVMGLYDGLGGIREEGSSYHLAKVTKTPIVLVVDAKGMGRSVLAQIAGFLAYDTEHLIQGVILNRMSKSYFSVMKPLLEEVGIAVLGYFPENKSMYFESRHLGLQMPDEIPKIKRQLEVIAKEFSVSVQVEQIIDMAGNAKPLTMVESDIEKITTAHCPVIAIAKDEAFCFYYEDNLRLLEENGAELAYFSPIHDRKLPDNCSGILLGGGYPELYAKELAANDSMREAIRTAIANNMPTVAECGGFMYLHSAIEAAEGSLYEMAGVLPGVCRNTGKLVRFGYIEIEEEKGRFLMEGERIRGHEFHYYDSEDNGSDCTAIKPVTGKTYPCIITGESYWFGFPHLYYPSNPRFAERFVELARKRHTPCSI